ncbi:MAG: DUF2924 domain-containing protein [Planctomycetes bacterium]|nr:DUF2924 domain-containing protein [Planctomycetota bacterium]
MGTKAKLNIGREVAAMRNMSVTELREKYEDVFGEKTRSRHKDFLVRRIAWRMQANVEGGLPEEMHERARELAADSDVRLTAPRKKKAPPAARPMPFAGKGDPRTPLPGTALTRIYKGREIVVKVLPGGFEHAGTVYRSLSAIAKEVTGTHWNGYNFFGLNGSGGAHGKTQ